MRRVSFSAASMQAKCHIFLPLPTNTHSSQLHSYALLRVQYWAVRMGPIGCPKKFVKKLPLLAALTSQKSAILSYDAAET